MFRLIGIVFGVGMLLAMHVPAWLIVVGGVVAVVWGLRAGQARAERERRRAELEDALHDTYVKR